jgi:hypothetical protein
MQAGILQTGRGHIPENPGKRPFARWPSQMKNAVDGNGIP